MHRTPIFPNRLTTILTAIGIICGTLWIRPTLAQTVYQVKPETPADLKVFLEKAVESGKISYTKHLKQAQDEVQEARTIRDRVRKAFRQYKAKKTDLDSAEQKLREAEAHLARVRSEPVLEWPVLKTLDQPGTMGILPHGFGVSLILDDNRALIYVFVEQINGQEGALFKNRDEAMKELVPSGSPLVLTGVTTSQWSEGDRVAGNSTTVYRIGPAEDMQGQRVYTIHPVDLLKYLEPVRPSRS